MSAPLFVDKHRIPGGLARHRTIGEVVESAVDVCRSDSDVQDLRFRVQDLLAAVVAIAGALPPEAQAAVADALGYEPAGGGS